MNGLPASAKAKKAGPRDGLQAEVDLREIETTSFVHSKATLPQAGAAGAHEVQVLLAATGGHDQSDAPMREAGIYDHLAEAS